MKWNGGISFPIQSGHPCLGCRELHFFDRMTLFYKKLPNVPGVGVESTANRIGAIATGAALVTIAAHAVGSTVREHKERIREDAIVDLPVDLRHV